MLSQTKPVVSGLVRVRSGRISSALQERVISTRSAAVDHQWFVFFLESGRALAEAHGTEYEMSGPALSWAPLDEDTRLRVSAGSFGYYLFFNHSLLGEAIGTAPEAAELRMFSSQRLVASFERSDTVSSRLENLFEQILKESEAREFGNDIAISAHLRILLVILRRSIDQEQVPLVANLRGTSSISRFRSLVETHFRARLSAKDYAQEMGMSYDRLHDLCVKAVGKPPAILLRERTINEARQLLQRTSMPIERISAVLGFSSSSQFNHFFKSMTDETPGRFRQRAGSAPDKAGGSSLRFADWP